MPTIRELRQAKFLEQRELAEKMGVSEASVSNWENGRKRPRPPHLRKLAKILGVSPSAIEWQRQERLPHSQDKPTQ